MMHKYAGFHTVGKVIAAQENKHIGNLNQFIKFALRFLNESAFLSVG
jgi:hypothetical protein